MRLSMRIRLLPGVDFAAERAVVHPEAVDLDAHVRRSFGLKTSSRPTFITYRAATMAVIPIPGTMNHHHMPRTSALFETATFSIRPSDITSEGPRPRKSRVAAMRIEPPNRRMNVRKR